MKIRFTDHAQFSLYKRNFSIEKMKAAILHPDWTEVTPDGKIVSRKRFIDISLQVVYAKRKNTYIIITVYFI